MNEITNNFASKINLTITITSIIISIVIAAVGWWINSQQSKQTDRILKQQIITEQDQRNADRVAMLLPSLASENKIERRMGFALVEHFQQMKQLPEEVLPLLKQYWTIEGITTIQKEAQNNDQLNEQDKINGGIAALFPRIYIHIFNVAQRKVAQKYSRILENANFFVPRIQKVSTGPQTIELRYFHETEANEAKRIVDLLQDNGLEVIEKYISGYENIQARHFELWFSDKKIQ